MASVKKNFFYSSILTSANYIFPLILFPYVSRVLGVENVGIVNFVDSVINYFILFSMMGVGIIGIREIAIAKSDKKKLSRAFSGLFFINMITTCIALVILLVSSYCIPQLRFHWNLMLVGAFKLVSNFMLIDWFYKGLEEFKFVTIRTVLIKLLFIISVFIFVKESSDYGIYYFLTVLMISANAVVNLAYSRQWTSLSLSSCKISSYAKPFFVLGVYTLLTNIYLTFNITYLGFVAGETEVGYYVTASKIHRILISLFTAFTGVMLPRISTLLTEKKNEKIKELLTKSNQVLFLFSIPLMSYLLIYAPHFVYFFAGSGYEGAVNPLRIIVPLILIIGYEQILVVEILTPLEMDRAQLVNSALGAFVAIILNILLVPILKCSGSAIVWLASELSVLLSAQYFVYKSISFGFPWKLLFNNIIINLPLFFILYLLYNIIDNISISLVISSLAFIAYFSISQYIFQKDLICNLFKAKKFYNVSRNSCTEY